VTHTNSGVVTVGGKPDVTVEKLINGSPTDGVDPGATADYLMTVENIGAGNATSVIVTIDIGDFVAFGVDSQGGQPFTFTDTGSPALPTNFFGTPQASIDGGPFQAMPSAPPAYNPDITAIRIEMNGAMEPGSAFTLEYQGEVE